MSISTVDKLFEQSAERSWRDLNEETLLSFQFTASDPESLDGITGDPPPPNEDPEIEFRYDMAGRGEMVRCLYCKHPNHFKGIVVKYPSGRRLVGRNCALNHHGVAFEQDLIDFEAAFERQSLARRRRALMAARPKIFQDFTELKADPASETHDRLMKSWRQGFGYIAVGIADVVRRDERLKVTKIERDEAAEKERKQRLGDRFEEERQKTKAAGKPWQIYKSVELDFGPVDGVVFFKNGIPISTRLEAIHEAVRVELITLANDELTSRQISTGFRKLAEKIDELASEFNRLDALAEAFGAANLAHIAKWANAQAEEQARREAVLENRKPEPFYPQFFADGQSLRWGMGRNSAAITLPDVYRTAPRTLLSTLKEALSFVYEP